MRPLSARALWIVAFVGFLLVPWGVAPSFGQGLPEEPAAHHLAPIGDTVQRPDGWYRGSGLSHGFNLSAGWDTYNVTFDWFVTGGTIGALRMESSAYVVRCVPPTAQVEWKNGTLQSVACQMADRAETRTPWMRLWTPGAGGAGELADLHGNLDTNATLALASTGSPLNPWPGFVVSLLAALGIAGCVAFGVLYTRELRMSRYLVRRLFEQTAGNLPKDWPEHLRRRVIARFLVGGKN